MTNFDFPQVELKYNVSNYEPKYKLSSYEDSYNYSIYLFDRDTIALRESFYVIFLNRANYVIGYFKMSDGGVAGTIIDIRLIMQAALLSSCSSVILTHNHPSGNTKPSTQDITVTNNIKAAANLFDINVLDHIIVTPYREYYSFANEGVL